MDQRSRLDVNCGDAGVSVSSMTRTNSRIQGFILTNGSFVRERSPFLTCKARDRRHKTPDSQLSPFVLGRLCVKIAR